MSSIPSRISYATPNSIRENLDYIHDAGFTASTSTLPERIMLDFTTVYSLDQSRVPELSRSHHSLRRSISWLLDRRCDEAQRQIRHLRRLEIPLT